jgi:hypothetical protein
MSINGLEKSKFWTGSDSMKKFALILILGFSLSACGSSGDDSSESDGSSSGGYLSCVLEYSQLRNEGIISATDAEIRSECAASSLP